MNFEKEAPDESKREALESIKVLMGLLESIRQERLTLKEVMPVNQFGDFNDHDRQLAKTFSLELKRQVDHLKYHVDVELHRQCSLYLESFTKGFGPTLSLHVGKLFEINCRSLKR